MRKQKRLMQRMNTGATALLTMIGAASGAADPWSFGVMSDTQWKANLDGQNPGTVAVGIVNQLNQQFINQGVKFVVQVGDLVDKESDANGRTMGVRSAAAQSLYDAGIGFFPLRGNHEGSKTAAVELQALYPQTQGQGANVFGAQNFSSPANLTGLTYSFDYNNARFVLFDGFTAPNGSTYSVANQQSWISDKLSSRPAGSQAFFFSHKNILGQNHKDNLFGNANDSSPDAQNAFIGSLDNNDVKYAISGHDHMHHRSVINSPDGQSQIQEVISASDSYKFYTPGSPSSARETAVSQELYRVGYYVYTVDGPRVTADYYSSDNGSGNVDVDLATTPTLSFEKRETFGYSLNGKQFLVAQGQSYAGVEDVSPFANTTAKILSGSNGSTLVDGSSRALTKDVNTGWSAADSTLSDVLSLWGMTDLTADHTDTFVLSMSYDITKVTEAEYDAGSIFLATKVGRFWINAVDENEGGTKLFVNGPWEQNYGLGTYGVDRSTGTAWAVINHASDFGVVVPEPGQTAGALAMAGVAGAFLFASRRQRKNQAA